MLHIQHSLLFFTLSVSKDHQLVKECLKLVPVEEKTAVEETFSQLVIKSLTAMGKK